MGRVEELDALLSHLQKQARVRRAAGLLILLALAGCVGWFAWQLWPREYRLRLSGGDILCTGHFMARLLAEGTPRLGVELTVLPTEGGAQSLAMLEEGKLDLAIVQGGLAVAAPHARHVATLPPVVLHLLARPGLRKVDDLRGRTVNTGPDSGSTWASAREVLGYAGLQEHVHYARTTFTDEDLTSLAPEDLPDAVFLLDTVPAPLAEFLVRERGFGVLEIPFPAALALRDGWVADERILAYSYRVDPPIPARDAVTVGVRNYLVARSTVPPEAVFRVLEALYSPNLNRRLENPVDEGSLLSRPEYPVDAGAVAYSKRDKPFLTFQTYSALTQQVGVLFSLFAMVMATRRWLKGPPPRPEVHDQEFHAYLGQVAGFERALLEAADLPRPERAQRVREVAREAALLQIQVLERYPQATLSDAHLVSRLLETVASTRLHCQALLSDAQNADSTSASSRSSRSGEGEGTLSTTSSTPSET